MSHALIKCNSIDSFPSPERPVQGDRNQPFRINVDTAEHNDPQVSLPLIVDISCELTMKCRITKLSFF